MKFSFLFIIFFGKIKVFFLFKKNIHTFILHCSQIKYLYCVQIEKNSQKIENLFSIQTYILTKKPFLFNLHSVALQPPPSLSKKIVFLIKHTLYCFVVKQM